MVGLPKLLLLVLLLIGAWFFRRWFAQQRQNLPRRRPAAPVGTPAIEAEDLVLCGVCAAYVSAQAPGCGRRDCPRPR